MQRRIIVMILIIIAAVAGAIYYNQQSAANDGKFVLSGTIEVTETNLPTVSGGQVKQVYVSEGDSIKKGQPLVDVYSQAAQVNERITSPIDGTVLERLVEPSEMAAPGSTVLVIAPTDQLYLKIFVPENRYGQITLGQTLPVTVDSFPGQTFNGRVSVISDKAEFTPRNVQTTDSRQTTVYAVKLELEPTGGKLKPGMPADVTFSTK
jgi:HlyD family secretion protein